MVFFSAGLLLWLLAVLMKYLPNQIVVLLWGRRRRAVLNENGTVAVDMNMTTKELKITGAVLLLKTLLDYLIWSIWHTTHPI